MSSIIESVGSYKDHVFIVKFHDLGYRTGYVKEEPEDDYQQSVYSLDVHGDVTYYKTHIPEVGQYLPPGTWIGFDCVHNWDNPDAYSCKKYFGKDPITTYGSHPAAEVRDLDFCENECRKLIDQLVG
jgi:hypothetical protein